MKVHQIRAIRALAVFAAFMVSSVASAATATSVTQWGITWTFDKAYEVGQYANGDYWVVGPVTITDISPRSTTSGGRVMHGTQLNPGRDSVQGYDSGKSSMSYSSSLNVAPSITGRPLHVTTGSVVSSISLENPPSSGLPLLKTLAVLTVVSAPPPAGSFRPSPYGTDKTSYWKESDLDYSILRSLPKVSGTPSLAEVTAGVRRFYNEQSTSWQARTIHAQDNQPEYGRDIANRVGIALLSLHLDYSPAQKRDLYVYLVQMGLDIYGAAANGRRWGADGGHNHGRKMPMLLAALALKDPNIRAMADASRNFIFQEDHQTFYVSQADVNRSRYNGDGRRRDPYTSSMIGMPEWGEKHNSAPERDGSNWDAYYRWVGSGFASHALMAHLTADAVNVWNWPAFFDYTDRFVRQGSPSGGTNGIPAFVQSMWKAYRDLEGGPPRSFEPEPPQLSVQ